MRILVTEQILDGNPRPRTRSRVIDHPKDEPLPEGAIETTEPARDWQEDK